MNSLLDGAGDQPTVDQNINYLQELVGENKKFKTNEDLAKGKYTSDQYIKTLEQKMDDLRGDYMKLNEEYNAGPKLKELIDQLAKERLASNNNPPVKEDLPPVVQFDPKKVEELVNSKYQEIETRKKQAENFNSVKAKLQERFGPNYRDTYLEQVTALGLTPEYADNLAQNYPSVFMKTFGLDQVQNKEQFQAPPKSDRRSDNFTPKGSEKRTWAFYQKMKVENPKRYHDPKTSVEMHNDMIALGDTFKDGDYSRFGD